MEEHLIEPATNPSDPRDLKEKQSAWALIWDLAKVMVIALGLVTLFHYYVAQPFIVQGSSMEPTFHTGEYLIIDELSYRFQQPDRGDVIVFKYPKDTSQYFIKRVIGLPGEKVLVADGHVKIFNAQHPDGFVLDEPYLQSQDITFSPGNPETVTLGSREYYVLGDNRIASSDSRFWGTVPSNDIVGRAIFRAYPLAKITDFTHVNYPSS